MGLGADGVELRRAFAVEHHDPRPGNLVAMAEALEDATQTGGPFMAIPRKRFEHSAEPATVSVCKLPPRFVAAV